MYIFLTTTITTTTTTTNTTTPTEQPLFQDNLSKLVPGKTSLDLNDARDNQVLGSQWHQLDHMQTICASLQTDNYNHNSSLN